MPYTHFQFKQFKIEQEKSSMKVCTDSCLFGAWVAEKIQQNSISPKNILDIGAGTGLLSLMLAQQSDAMIDAIEIDHQAYEQTKENFAASPWNQQLQAIHGDIIKMPPGIKYDLIISNPPFFEGDLKSTTNTKNLAKHHEGLTLQKLLDAVNIHLSPGGKLAVLLPFHRLEHFKKLALQQPFFLEEELLIRQSPRHSYFRCVLLLGRKEMDFLTATMSIKDGQQNYTDRFAQLLHDYYLHL